MGKERKYICKTQCNLGGWPDCHLSPLAQSCHQALENNLIFSKFRLYFSIAAQIAQVAQPVLFSGPDYMSSLSSSKGYSVHHA